MLTPRTLLLALTYTSSIAYACQCRAHGSTSGCLSVSSTEDACSTAYGTITNGGTDAIQSM
ncbi:hypothetical protein AC578_5656 [Pseudocercospora eumusae]|uniref:Extracellular membrane protein CFEM domain-containing protein n=1 Tax=Pseudocercospora eumusae TaxID=321146 RepID=A0A139HT73_9PEZI|nr:hypothetical protein AC578_5656 [Pseudocercospora eumusae]